uniref:SEA domain-containing protein n=1 Tax=Gasterosteus aculeatus TaxID=69293 RepID=G3Q730_GASAC
MKTFPSYRSMTVNSFSPGSIINDITLFFNKTFVPQSVEIKNTLTEAATNVTGFDIELSSIIVNAISAANTTAAPPTAPTVVGVTATTTAAPITKAPTVVGVTATTTTTAAPITKAPTVVGVTATTTTTAAP